MTLEGDDYSANLLEMQALIRRASDLLAQKKFQDALEVTLKLGQQQQYLFTAIRLAEKEFYDIQQRMTAEKLKQQNKELK